MLLLVAGGVCSQPTVGVGFRVLLYVVGSRMDNNKEERDNVSSSNFTLKKKSFTACPVFRAFQVVREFTTVYIII